VPRKSGGDLKKPHEDVHKIDAVYVMINYERIQKHEILYKACHPVRRFTYEPLNLYFCFHQGEKK